MFYKDKEIDISTTNYSEGVAILPLPTGEIVCIPENGATHEELEIIRQIKEDVEGRSEPEPLPYAEPGPTIEEYLIDLDYRLSMFELGL